MRIPRATPINELLARLVFLVLPTLVVAYFLVLQAQQYYGIIGNGETGLLSFLPQNVGTTLQLTLFAAAGMIGGAIFYTFRFRFLPTFFLLAVGLYAIYKGLDAFAVGEFDAFFISVQFLVFTVLFVVGWLVGWGFVRVRYFAILIASVLLLGCIYVIAKGKVDTAEGLLKTFAPILLYALYLVFTAEQIYNYKDKSQQFWWYLSQRLIAFSALAILILGGVIYLMRSQIKQTVADYGGGGTGSKNSMLKKKGDNTFDLEQYTKLRGSLGRTNELLFAAHIDNFFPSTDIPNPLYLTAFYYTKFDTSTETFERDKNIPFNDLFEPNPASLSLFFTKEDSTVIRNALGAKMRRTVNMEVYSKALSPTTYLAPSTGFFVQPIAIEKDFREEFKTAFRAKSYVSELNSAYFIYNPQKNEELRTFQEQRFEVLRKVEGYEKMDRRFMNYYTFMPGDAKFNRIGALAQKVTAGKEKAVDKMLAIRDYFTSNDETGEPLFTYTDNPGVPDIPDAKKLQYFLFENHKGYCAYYAGATLFMLRALGIPSRIAVGFMTVDRSDKNAGWYWYYADQAHAWVQVYFPGYGWLDFDTTVGNDEAQQSPKPDGTPPMQPPRAWLAAEGLITDVDTLHKLLTMKVRSMVYHDKEYQLKDGKEMVMDVKIAAIKRDSVDVPLSNIKVGEQATAVSYAEAFKKLPPRNDETAEVLAARFPNPAPVDEVYLKRTETAKEKEAAAKKAKEAKTDYARMLWIAGGILLLLVLLILLLPTLILFYYKRRYVSAKGEGKPYWAYRATTFFLHQFCIYRGDETPMQYARNQVDARFGTAFGMFMNVYLKQKYAKQPLNENEQAQASGFLFPFLKKVKQQIRWKERVWRFTNAARTVRFFGRREEE